MWKRVAGFGAGVLLTVSGGVVVSKWHDTRITACQQRSAQLSMLELGRHHPDGMQPLEPQSGYDLERVAASAIWQYAATNGPRGDTLSDRVAADVPERDVTAFYRRVLEDSGWQIAGEPVAGPNATSLCARKELPSGRTYVNLSFGVPGMYELRAADTADVGAACYW